MAGTAGLNHVLAMLPARDVRPCLLIRTEIVTETPPM
eukprot:COSAG01_NODE_57385_length_312_cov_1.690141_2_plen_36_part_01